MGIGAEVLNRPATTVLLPLMAIVSVALVVRVRRMSWRDDLGLAAPDWKRGAPWFGVYLVWMLTTDHMMQWRGPWDFSVWAQLPVWVVCARVLGVGLLGPIAEELIFRGILHARLTRTRLRIVGAIAVCAASWTAMHYFYSTGVIAIIFVGGLLLGVARWRSGSVFVPILMHVCWNLYAVW